ncbi:MAG: lactate utilization protein [Chloroflexi bacterium]|nr:lactate utilization protein [Chloroflexota bacterium]
MSSKEEFLANIRQILGKPGAITPVTPVAATGLATPHGDARAEAEQARAVADERAGELFGQAAEAAEAAGWTVHRLDNIEQVANRVIRICRERNITATLKSTHNVLDRAGVAGALTETGIQCETLRDQGNSTRDAAFATGAGITGADWFIAESGTLVLHPRQGASRLISIAPPIHIVVLEQGSVLPSLDELWAIERASHIDGELGSMVNLISGPSRTGDIEATIVKGIHGPVETHLIMVG